MLYAGVTSRLAARSSERGSAFCRRYGLERLVLALQFDTIETATAREKQVKAWKRA